MKGKSIIGTAFLLVVAIFVSRVLLPYMGGAATLGEAPVWPVFLGIVVVFVLLVAVWGNVFKQPIFVRTGLDRTDRIFVTAFLVIFILGLIGLVMSGTLQWVALIGFVLVSFAMVAVAVFRTIRDTWRERRSKPRTRYPAER